MNNADIKQLLNNAVINDKVLHSYMFVGNKLTQKEQIAKQFVKMILCLAKDNILCETCKSCIEIKDNNHPDFEIVQLDDDETSIKIEQIRKLQGDIIKKPIVSTRKVYIIKNSDKMTIRCSKLFAKNIGRTTRICCNNIISRK